MFHDLGVSIADHALQVPGVQIILFLLHRQTALYQREICMLLVIKHIPAGDTCKGFHLYEVPVA